MSGDTELINILNNKLNLIKNSGTVSITTDDDGTDATGLNINKNLTVGGNFTVNGTTTTLSTTNSVIKDSLIELGNGTTEAPANDSGIVIERGTSANAFMGWDESADKFKVGTGTFTGSDSGDLAIDTGTLVANLEGNVTGNCSGTAATVTGTAQTAITSVGTLTALDVDNITIDGNTISSTDTDGNITLTPNGTGVVAIGAGNLSYGGTAVTATADELNIMDGSATTQATVTLEDGDGIVISDGDVMKQCLASDIKTYVSDLTLTTASQTAITGVGALTTGSIASGFGSISTGSAITTTGDITGGKVIADNITIDGNTISSTAGTDLNITPLAGQQLVLDNTIVVDAGVISGATTITASGLITGGSFSATSDKNLKENIVKIEDALDTIMKIEGYGFNFKDSGNYSHGVIAQEVEEILPSLVTTNDSGVKSVDYLQLIPYLIESVKHLKSEIEELKSS